MKHILNGSPGRRSDWQAKILCTMVPLLVKIVTPWRIARPRESVNLVSLLRSPKQCSADRSPEGLHSFGRCHLKRLVSAKDNPFIGRKLTPNPASVNKAFIDSAYYTAASYSKALSTSDELAIAWAIIVCVLNYGIAQSIGRIYSYCVWRRRSEIVTL